MNRDHLMGFAPAAERAEHAENYAAYAMDPRTRMADLYTDEGLFDDEDDYPLGVPTRVIEERQRRYDELRHQVLIGKAPKASKAYAEPGDYPGIDGFNASHGYREPKHCTADEAIQRAQMQAYRDECMRPRDYVAIPNDQPIWAVQRDPCRDQLVGNVALSGMELQQLGHIGAAEVIQSRCADLARQMLASLQPKAKPVVPPALQQALDQCGQALNAWEPSPYEQIVAMQRRPFGPL